MQRLQVPASASATAHSRFVVYPSGDALFGAVNFLNREGFSVCTVKAGMKASPNLTAEFGFGRARVSVSNVAVKPG